MVQGRTTEHNVRDTSAQLMSSIPKKGVSVRANQQQLSILRKAFDQSHVPQDLKCLATETGLTKKWISGWFQRERKKLKAKGISSVKEECQHPRLAVIDTPKDKPSDSESTNNPLSHSPEPLRKKAKILHKKPSLIIKTEIVEDTLPLDSIPVSVPSASVISGRLQSGGIVNSTDQVHIPATTSSKSTQQPKRRRGKQTSASATKATTISAKDSIQLKDTKSDIVQSPLQTPFPIESQSKSRASTATNVTEVSESKSLETVATDPSEVVPKPTVFDRSTVSSFEPLFPSPGPTLFPAASTGMMQRNQRTNLHSHLQTLDVTPLPRPHLDHVQRTSQPQSNNCDQTTLPEVLNPNLAPLKHLTALREKILNGSLSRSSGTGRKDVLEVLLDERLTSDDPFQAAMGLVFWSRLARASRKT